jgi:DNA-binding transcriptional regulator YdaS (Cro superfamily)
MQITKTEREALAQQCSISDAYLYQILARIREASPELCVQIEKSSNGRITRRWLRPNDWARIWPELVEVRPVSMGSLSAD